MHYYYYRKQKQKEAKIHCDCCTRKRLMCSQSQLYIYSDFHQCLVLSEESQSDEFPTDDEDIDISNDEDIDMLTDEDSDISFNINSSEYITPVQQSFTRHLEPARKRQKCEMTTK